MFNNSSMKYILSFEIVIPMEHRAINKGLWIELELRPLSARFLYVVQ